MLSNIHVLYYFNLIYLKKKQKLKGVAIDSV